MPDYQCCVLDRHNRVIYQAEPVAEDLGAAVKHGLQIIGDDQTRPPYSQASSIEIWVHDARMFPPE
jgi:hypothetical protein